MNSSMSEIRERNLEISEFSENTQGGVGSLQESMREVAENLSQFKIETGEVPEKAVRIAGAHKVYAEDEMSALETHDEERLSV